MPLDDIQIDALMLFTRVEGQLHDNLTESIRAVEDEETRGVLISWAGNMLTDALKAAHEHKEAGDQQCQLQAEIVAYGIASVFRLAILEWYVKEKSDV